MSIKSTAEFNALIGAAVENALNEVIEKALKLLNNKIDSIVYGGGGSEWYSRTGSFGEQWEGKNLPGSATVKRAMIDQNPSLLPLNLANYQHGSPSWGDFRDGLADAIFQGYEVFNSGHMIGARNAWDTFIGDLDAGKIERWFLAAMRRQGLKIY